MPIGNPIQKNNDTRVISATATTGQTDFTVTGGYTINAIGVFRNGVRLNNSTDFTAADGSTVSLNVACDAGDTVTFHIFDKFTVANAIVGAASTQTVYGNLAVNGELYSTNLNPTNIDIAGIGTIAKAIIGTGVTIDQSNIDTVGIISATTFTGDVTGSISGATGTFSGDITANGNIVGDNSTNISGIASVTATDFYGTVQTAAQANITSLGTLTGLTVSGDVSIADKIIHTGDTDTAIRFSGADTVSVETAGTERLNITASAISASTMFKSDSFEANADLVLNSDSNANNSTNDNIIFKNAGTERVRIKGTGYTGIGTASPQEKLHLYGGNCALEVDAPANRYCSVGFSVDGASKWWMGRGDSDVLSETSFFIGKDAGSAVDKGGNSAKLVIDSDGRVCVGTTVSRSVGTATAHKIQVEAVDATAGVTVTRCNAGTTGPYLSFGKSRAASLGDNTVVQSGDSLGMIRFAGADGTDTQNVGAQIQAFVDGTPGTDDMPGRLIFSTTADGANTSTERLRITSAGLVGVGIDAPTEKLHVIGQVGGSNPTAGSKWDIARFVAHDYSATNSGGLTIGAYWNNSSVSGRRSYIQSSQNTDSGSTARDLLLNPDGGNIGIGTINPDGKLHISSGTANSDCVLIIEADTDNNDETANPQIWFKQDGDITAGFVGQSSNKLVISSNVGSTSGISFRTGVTANTGTTDPLTGSTERLFITQGGLIGIGTDDPGSTLHLYKHSDNHGIKLQRSGTNPGSATLNVNSNGELALAADNNISYTTGGSQQHIFYRGGTEVMRINASGIVDVAGHLISSTSGAIDPDSYPNHFMTGNIQDGSGWGVHGIAFGDAAGDMMAMGHNGSAAFFGMQNGSASTMETFMKFEPNGPVELYYNAGLAAKTVETNSLRGFLVGSDTYLNDSVTHGELIVRKDLASPNDAAITQCARQTLITNEQTAGGNGYGGAIFFGTQDVDTSNQYTNDMCAIGGSADSADTGNAEKSGSFYIWTRHNATFSAKFKVRYDGNLYGTDTTIGSLSDSRLKENIEDFSFDLNKFKQLQPKRFNWKHPEYHNTTPSSGKHRGFIAQDLEAIDPELVDTDKIDKDNPESSLVDEGGLGKTTHLGKSDAMYVSVINQLIAKIETLETKVAALESA